MNIGGEGVEDRLEEGGVGSGMEVMGWVVEGEVLGKLGEGDEMADSAVAEHGNVGVIVIQLYSQCV